MAWDEFSVVLKAREFVRKANITAIPAPLEHYLVAARATVRELADMAADEAGSCFPMADGSFRICINANDRIERRRFTVCHEIGHIVLGLKSDHNTEPWTTGRPLTERLCDLFAAELLLPGKLFELAAESVPVSLAGIDALSQQFEASVTGLDPVWWTSFQRGIRCPNRWPTHRSGERAASSPTSSKPAPCAWCLTKGRASVPPPAISI